MNKTTIVYACLSVFLQPCAFFRNAPFFPLIFALLLSAVGVTGPCTGFHLGLDHPGLVEDGPSCIGCVCEGVISVPIFSPVVQAVTSRDGFSVLFLAAGVKNLHLCGAGSIGTWQSGAGVENPVPVLAPAGHGWFPWLRE